MADDRIDWETPVFFVLAVLLVCVVSYFAGRVKGRRIGYEVGYSEGFAAGWAAPHPADTATRTDTVFIDRPVEVVRWRDRVEYLAVTDTIRVADSVFVEVPIEVRQYADSTYRAQVSGWHPSLDWIEVYARTQTITSTIVKEAPRWSLGVTAGPGLLYDGNLHAGVGIVAGVQYRF
jgi:hypothetical protein